MLIKCFMEPLRSQMASSVNILTESTESVSRFCIIKQFQCPNRWAMEIVGGYDSNRLYIYDAKSGQ